METKNETKNIAPPTPAAKQRVLKTSPQTRKFDIFKESSNRMFSSTKTCSDSFTLSKSERESDDANRWVPLFSMEEFTPSDVKDKRKKSHSRSLSVNRPL